MIVWIWGVIPTWVRYAPFIEKRVMADGTESEVIGTAHWVWVDILESERGNIGLLAHELTHCKQAWKLPFIHKFLRGANLRYRARCEAAAYAAQVLAYGPLDEYREARINAYAYLLANAYGLTITQDAAREMILEEVRK